MFSPTIMLLIGGFTIASALSKTSIDRVLITRVLSFAGTKPSVVLLSFMGVSCFASMWISNVAAPTLCFTLIRVCLVSVLVSCTVNLFSPAANLANASTRVVLCPLFDRKCLSLSKTQYHSLILWSPLASNCPRGEYRWPKFTYFLTPKLDCTCRNGPTHRLAWVVRSFPTGVRNLYRPHLAPPSGELSPWYDTGRI